MGGKYASAGGPQKWGSCPPSIVPWPLPACAFALAVGVSPSLRCWGEAQNAVGRPAAARAPSPASDQPLVWTPSLGPSPHPLMLPAEAPLHWPLTPPPPLALPHVGEGGECGSAGVGGGGGEGLGCWGLAQGQGP